MKRSILTLLIVSLFYGQNIWRVDNNSQNVSDFTSLQAAHDDASVLAGDIIYVVGTVTNYGNVTFTKQLKIYGPGYYLGQNPNTQANKNDARFDDLFFNAGSEGSELYGIRCNAIDITADNISISRCRVTSTGSSIYVDGTPSNSTANVIISQSRVHGYIQLNDNCDNTIISNSIILYLYMPQTSSTSIISNTVFTYSGGWTGTVYNSTLQNNIFYYTGDYSGMPANNNTLNNNISAGTGLNTGDGNLNSVNLSADVFVASGTSDGSYQLKSGSTAAGAGVAGVDAGAFGGTNPYVLSGIPAIPSIYSVTVPTYGTSSGLNITIKARSNN